MLLAWIVLRPPNGPHCLVLLCPPTPDKNVKTNPTLIKKQLFSPSQRPPSTNATAHVEASRDAAPRLATPGPTPTSKHLRSLRVPGFMGPWTPGPEMRPRSAAQDAIPPGLTCKAELRGGQCLGTAHCLPPLLCCPCPHTGPESGRPAVLTLAAQTWSR